eukprot:SAG22_NODE_263_length_13359_cov_3.396531_11_plen_267_part_00
MLRCFSGLSSGMRADTVLDRASKQQLAWYYRNPELPSLAGGSHDPTGGSHPGANAFQRAQTQQETEVDPKVRQHSAPSHRVLPTVPTSLTRCALACRQPTKVFPDPLLHRTFGAVVSGECGTAASEAGDGGGERGGCQWAARSPRLLVTTKPVAAARLAITTHTAQTATVAEWEAQLGAQLAAVAPASASRVAAAHAERAAAMAEFWGRSYVHVGTAPVPPQVDPAQFSQQAVFLGNISDPANVLVAAFNCSSPAVSGCWAGTRAG